MSNTTTTTTTTTTSNTDTWSAPATAAPISPEQQAKLRDAALAKILLKSNRAGYATEMRLGNEVLVRDSKKTGYFPARLVCNDDSDKPVPENHIRIHYDGRPEGEFRDIPQALVYRLPNHELLYDSSSCHLNILLSPWVLLDDMYNFENTPLLAYAKVFERTEFRKFRVLFDGSFEMVDAKGRIVKVQSEWVRHHSTAHPDAIQEAIEAAERHEQFLDLIYGASHRVQKTSCTPVKVEANSQSTTTSNHNKMAPQIHYQTKSGDSNGLPASFANAIHIFAQHKGLSELQTSATTIYQQGSKLPVTSQLRTDFMELVNRLVHPLGYRMEALRFFNLTHDSKEAGAAPVVALIHKGNGFGQWVAFYDQWIVDSSQSFAAERTIQQLERLYGKGVDPKAIWSYCLVPLKSHLRNHVSSQNAGGLFKKKNRSKRSRGSSGKNPSTPQQPREEIPDKRSRYY